jgi:hypothetical protein
VSLLIDQVPEDADVGPSQLKAYLMSAGWNLIRADSESASELWEAEDGSPYRSQVILPVDPTFVDYRRRLSDSLQRLCDVYGWDLSQLLRSVQAVRSDMLFIRADQTTRFDSIPLRQAEQLIHGTVQMLQAAAWSTVSPRASLSGRKPNVVTQFLDDDLRMGHTQRGSFVLTVLTRVDDEVEVATSHDLLSADEVEEAVVPAVGESAPRDVSGHEETRFMLPPFQRRVMSTLATGLEETKNLTESTSGSSRMELAVGRGVSAQLCASLSEMTKHEGLRSLGMSFQWAPLPLFETPPVSLVSIGRDNIDALNSLTERFRAQERNPNSRVTIYGRVVRLERTDPKQGEDAVTEAIVTVVGVEGRKTRRQARIEVSGELHQIAIRSYERQRSISVTGELCREGQGYWLRGEVTVVD